MIACCCSILIKKPREALHTGQDGISKTWSWQVHADVLLNKTKHKWFKQEIFLL
jgi:hypothetical protein